MAERGTWIEVWSAPVGQFHRIEVAPGWLDETLAHVVTYARAWCLCDSTALGRRPLAHDSGYSTELARIDYGRTLRRDVVGSGDWHYRPAPTGSGET